ncbi:MAG: hypothetical protein K8R59_12705 [Thermoanaerobaculales bacterium]|nr:hypothetical protein [Thermoanaerobaculales bacterium]
MNGDNFCWNGIRRSGGLWDRARSALTWGLLFPGVTLLGAMPGLACEPWQLGEPFPFGQHLYDVHHSSGLWIAVGRGGTILTSTDAIDWAARDSGVIQNLYEVSGHEGRYIAVGTGGLLLVSDDGLTWVSAGTLPLEDVREVIWSGTSFVAVGAVDDDTTGIATSPDGENWSIAFQRPSPLPYTGVAKTDFGILVSGYYYVGTVRGDGDSWEDLPRSRERLASNGPMTVGTAQDGQLGWSFYWSEDGGESWTWATYPDQHMFSPELLWTGREFLAFGQCDTYWCGYGPLRVFRSIDGKEWVDIDTPSDRRMYGAAATVDFTVFVGEWGSIKTWSAGAGWKSSEPGTTIGLYEVASSDTRSVAVGAEGFGATSTDGVNWEPFRLDGVERLEDVIWVSPTPDWPEGRFLAVGWHDDPVGAVVASSVDGLSWEVQKLFPGVQLFGVTETSFGFVAVGFGLETYQFSSLRSVDGVDWTYHPTPHSGWWFAKVAWNGKTLVATSDNALFASSDGKAWIDVSPEDMDLLSTFWDVATDGSNFVAVEERDYLTHLWSSPDGLTWTHEIGNLQIRPRAIESIGDRFLVAGWSLRHGWGILFDTPLLWYALDGSLYWPDFSEFGGGYYSGVSQFGDQIIAVDYYGQTAHVNFGSEPASPRVVGPTVVCSGDTVTLETIPDFSSYLWRTGETTESIVAPFADLATYQVTGTDFQGCRMTTPPHTVTGIPPPTTSILGPTTISPGEQAELVATAGYSGYLWSTGESTREIGVAPIETTGYTVSVSTFEGCAGVSDVHTVTVVAPIFSDGFESGDPSLWSATVN